MKIGKTSKFIKIDLYMGSPKYNIEWVQANGVSANWELNIRLNRNKRTGNLTVRLTTP